MKIGVYAYFNLADFKKLKEASKKEGLSKSAWVRRACLKFLEGETYER